MPKCLLVTLLVLLWSLSLPAAARSFVDAGGRVVELPDRIDRVYPAGPPAAVMIYVLAPEKLLGWHRQPSAAEKQLLLPAAGLLPTLPRLTGKGDSKDLTLLQASGPDIIIDVGTVDNDHIALAERVQQQSGIPYVLIDGSLARSAESLRQLGDLLEVSRRGEELARFAAGILARHQHDRASLPPSQRPGVYYGRGADGLQTAPAGSLNAEVIDLTGGRNVATAAEGDMIAEVSLQQVCDWNPEIILAASPLFADQVRRDPDWADVAAVENGKVFATPTLPFGWVDAPPGINRLIGLSWLTQILHPKFDQPDLLAEAKSFFKLFYHIDVNLTQVEDILKGKGSGN